MSNGRLEKETVEFAKIEGKLKFLPKIFTDYYYTIRAEKKSYSTISKYIMYINVFMRHFTDGKKDEEFYKKVTTMDFNKYMISLETKKVGKSVKQTTSGFRANNWNAINSFFEFLVDTGKIEKNPISPKSRPKITDNASVTYLTEEEVAGIIENIKYNAKETLVNRDLCIFILGVTTGLRVAAITQIDIEDIDLDKLIGEMFDIACVDIVDKAISVKGAIGESDKLRQYKESVIKKYKEDFFIVKGEKKNVLVYADMEEKLKENPFLFTTGDIRVCAWNILMKK